MGTGAFFHIKAKASGFIAARFAFGQLAKEIANFIEKFDIGCRIGAGIAPNRRLVDGNHFIDVFNALDFFMGANSMFAAMQMIG